MTTRRKNMHVARTAEERAALTSPIRLEILGQFTSPGGMSIADIAERMGRPAASLYYHFRILEKAGLIVQTGLRPAIKKSEALYEPVAHRFAMAAESCSPSAARDALKTISYAFRMAERDFEAAMESGEGRITGKHRNLFAGRLHCRITKETLAEINEHIQAIEKILTREARRTKLPPDADQYCSLTIALLPLRGRGKDQRSS